MISVEHLTKRFGGVTALDDVSFELAARESMALLGPNGAGKTTTLRILACYFFPTGGRVRVCGMDAVEESLEVRRRIGYLPEDAPMPPDMRVWEYLRFRGALRGLRGKLLRAKVGETVELMGLVEVRHRMVGRLSKGHRRRVALADAILHDPAVLLLDEPTLGLDPAQARAMRVLLKTFAQTHTVLLSTNNLEEAEAICRRVAILDKGRLSACGSWRQLPGLADGHARFVVDVKASAQAVLARLEQIPEIVQISWEADGEWNRFTVECPGGADIRTALFRMGVEQHWPVRELAMRATTLEDVFMAATGSAEGRADGGQGLSVAGRAGGGRTTAGGNG